MGKSILEEAVDDVQALKRAAEENAKNLLVEAMSPRIKDFIQSHLGQEGVDAAMALDTEGQNGVEETAPNNADMYEIDVNEGDDEDDKDEDTMSTDTDTSKEDEEDDDEGDVDVDVSTEAKEVESDDVDESVEITHQDLQRAFAEVLKQGLKKEAASGPGKFGDIQDPNDGEYGLAHKVPGEVQWADGEKVIKKAKNAKQITKEQYEKKISALQQQLAQYAEAFKYLKKNLNEMNVFNAKLLYTTRLMQGNLTNKQKLAVVESIDNAKNKHEVELVYKTLSESLKIAGALNEDKKNGVKGPKASRFTKPSSTVINEGTSGNTQASRWAELAGLVD